jgi:hypothetical protein
MSGRAIYIDFCLCFSFPAPHFGNSNRARLLTIVKMADLTSSDHVVHLTMQGAKRACQHTTSHFAASKGA